MFRSTDFNFKPRVAAIMRINKTVNINPLGSFYLRRSIYFERDSF